MTILNAPLSDRVPIRMDADGVARIGNTRVRLETLVEAFHSGHAAEEILLKYPSLELKDIYAVIAFYLAHPEEIDIYIDERRRAAEAVRAEVKLKHPSQGVRERLLARRTGGW